MNILSHRNNIVLFLACNMAAMQNLYYLVKRTQTSHDVEAIQCIIAPKKPRARAEDAQKVKKKIPRYIRKTTKDRANWKD